ncbi:MAG: hypothetical protein ACRCX2_12465 [Paraclostridium sp.]
MKKTLILISIIVVLFAGLFITKKINTNINNSKIESENYSLHDIENSFSEDVEETNNRYKEIDKDNLTYEMGFDAKTENLKDPYFYLTDNGISLNVEANKPFKSIDNKKYGKVLLGYSYAELKDSFTKEHALKQANLILPDNSQELFSTAYDDYELVHYSSSEGQFIVYLGYEQVMSTDSQEYHYNTDKYQSLAYYKEF